MADCSSNFLLLLTTILSVVYLFLIPPSIQLDAEKLLSLNDDDVDDSSMFSLKKFNYIWMKAVHQNNLSQDKLNRLNKSLKKLDKMSLKLKHSDIKKKEQNVQKKKEVESYLETLLKEFGLHQVVEDISDQLDVDHVVFRDVRIQQLWRSAVEGGKYTFDELRSLYEEMRHMEVNIDDAHMFAKNTEDIRRKVVVDDPDDSRSADEEDVKKSSERRQTIHVAREAHNELKQKKERIEKQVERIEKNVLNKRRAEFSDDRVSRLWNTAQSGTFSDEELRTVREELKHFQKSIDKLQHWKNMNVRSRDVSGDVIGGDVTHIQEKISEYKKKVKKYHKTMMKKVKEKAEL